VYGRKLVLEMDVKELVFFWLQVCFIKYKEMEDRMF